MEIAELLSERDKQRELLRAMYAELDSIIHSCKKGRNLLEFKVLRRVRQSWKSDKYGFNYIKHVAKDESHLVFVVSVLPKTKLPGFKTDVHCYLRVVSGEVVDEMTGQGLCNNYIMVFKPGSLIKLSSISYSVIEMKFKKV